MSLRSRISDLEDQVTRLTAEVRGNSLEAAKVTVKANMNEQRLDEMINRLWPLFRGGASVGEALIANLHNHDED